VAEKGKKMIYMKEKINQTIGSIVIFLAKYITMGIFFAIISVIVFENQKEEIFFESMKYFQSAYDEKVEELQTDFGVVDKNDIDQDDYKITNIGFAENPKQKKVPKIVAQSAIICTKKILPEDPKDYTQSMIEDINRCIDQQIKDAIIIREIYMEQIYKLPEGPTKIILKSIIVGCNEENTIKEQGVTDYSISLQCIRSTIKDLNKKLDQEIMHNRMKKGEVL
jgi:hypothetical protein